VDAGIFLPTREVRAILADPDLPAATRACLERFFRWGAAPTVDGYCDLFAAGGTLLDADMAAPIRGGEIRASITRVLQLLPDFRFRPVRAVHEGPHVFVLAANRATLGERALVWNAVYALTLAGDRIGAGRRYYDQAALLTGAETFAVVPAGGADAAAGTGAEPAPDGLARDLAARAAVWNRRDLPRLSAPLGRVRLHLAGVAGPLERAADVGAALAAVATRLDGLAIEPGAVVRSDRGSAVEWVGTIGTGAARRRFALVELGIPLPEACEWHVVFNTLGL
jgi:hypothetical protein